MGKLRATRPSPAIVVAVLALVAALAGTAAADPFAQSSEGAKKAKRALRKANKAQRNAKKAQKSAEQASEGAKTAQQAASSAQGVASSAQGLARSANDLANGVHQVGIRYVTGADASETAVLDLHGLQIVASCVGGELDVRVRTTVDSAMISVALASGTDTTDVHAETAFNVGDDLPLLPPTEDLAVGHAEYTNPNGGTVSVNWQSIDTALVSPDPECVFTGVAHGFG